MEPIAELCNEVLGPQWGDEVRKHITHRHPKISSSTKIIQMTAVQAYMHRFEVDIEEIVNPLGLGKRQTKGSKFVVETFDFPLFPWSFVYAYNGISDVFFWGIKR